MSDPLNVGVVGLGLIGGSFALDAQANGHGVVGYDIDADSCAYALEHGIATHASTNIAALDDCAAILVAVPVGESGRVFAQLAQLEMPNLQAIFDAGSVKGRVLAEAARLGAKRACFVACHPIAGTEDSGVRAATAGLFRGRRLVMCDPPAASAATALCRRLWEECGSVVTAMEASEHDRIFAMVSHLPHMLAFALVGNLGARDERDEILAYAASGFADFTRIASSDANMWRDVCLANEPNLSQAIGAYIEDLRKLRAAIDANDGAALHAFFDNAKVLRDTWMAGLASPPPRKP